MKSMNKVKFISCGIVLCFLLVFVVDLEARKYPESIIYETNPHNANHTKYISSGNFLNESETNLRLEESTLNSNVTPVNRKRLIKKRKNCHPKFPQVCKWRRQQKSRKHSIER